MIKCVLFFEINFLQSIKCITMTNQTFFKYFSVFLFSLILVFSAEGQISNPLKKAKDALKKETDKTLNQNNTNVLKSGDKKSNDPSVSAVVPKGTKDIYVSVERGSNRRDGSKSSPVKDLQKAIDIAPEGAVIHVAQGNYLGKLDAGYFEVKKYLSIIGGYSDDFSTRNPVKYRTMIQPPATAIGTNANHGLMDIYVKGKRNGVILIDGLFFDKGFMNRYVSPNVSDPRFAAPEGCETGILNPPGMNINQPYMRAETSVSNQLIHGDVEGQVTIRNCVFVNGSHFGIQMGHIGGHYEIYNNIFINSRMAAVEIRGMNNKPGESTVDFHHNTVLFTWRRDWAPGDKDMGYAFRFMTRVDADIHHNIIGCSDFSALDRTYIDADKTRESERVTSAWDNLFFNNIEADLTLPSGGGKFLRIFAKQFEDVDQLVKYEGNREMNNTEIGMLSQKIDEPYLKAFLSMESSSSLTHNPNSSENTARQILGLNQRGTSKFSVSMYSNAYPFEKAADLFGAIKSYGAQLP